MTYKVALTSRAELDRQRAYEWCRKNYSEAYATRWFNGISRVMDSLARHPERWHMASEKDRFQFKLYELTYGTKRNKHRVLYRIHNDLVLVLHIRHSAQRDLTENDL